MHQISKVNHVNVFLHSGTFYLVVLQLILALKLSKLEHRAADCQSVYKQNLIFWHMAAS